MEEENLEYLKATKENNLVEIADALGDMLYILCGTIISHGLQDKIEEIFQEIQNSNMSKLGKNARQMAEDHSWEVQEKKLFNLYERVLNIEVA